MSDAPRAFHLPVLLGTPRQGRHSEPVAALLAEELALRPGVTTEVIDVRDYPVPPDDAGQAARDPRFAAKMTRADGLVIVCPEYNHGFPGALKALLDTCLEEYVHKPAGVVGVSAGPFGGTRAIQDLLPVLRELGLVCIFWDVNVSHVASVFDAEGRLLDEAWRPRVRKFLAELEWMAETLRHGRRNIALRD